MEWWIDSRATGGHGPQSQDAISDGPVPRPQLIVLGRAGLRRAIGRRPKINKKREEKTGAGPTLEFRSARPFVWSAVVPPLHTAVAPLPFPLFLPPPSSLEHASAARRGSRAPGRPARVRQTSGRGNRGRPYRW